MGLLDDALEGKLEKPKAGEKPSSGILDTAISEGKDDTPKKPSDDLRKQELGILDRVINFMERSSGQANIKQAELDITKEVLEPGSVDPLEAVGRQVEKSPLNLPGLTDPVVTGAEIAALRGASTEPEPVQVAHVAGIQPRDIILSGNPFTDEPTVKRTEFEAPHPSGATFPLTEAQTRGVFIDIRTDPTLLPTVGFFPALKGVLKGVRYLSRGTALADKVADIAKFADTSIIQPGKEVLKEGAQVVGEGLTAAKDVVVGAGESIVKRVKQALTSNLDDTLETHIKTAEEFGLSPKATAELSKRLEFSRESFVNRRAKSDIIKRDIPDEIADYNRPIVETGEAFERQIADAGEVLDTHTAGQQILTGIEEGLDKVYKEVDFTYMGALDALPNHRFSRNVEIVGNDKVRNAINKIKREKIKTKAGSAVEAEETIKVIEDAVNHFNNPRDFVRYLRNLGEKAFGKGAGKVSDLPLDKKTLRDFYSAMSSIFVEDLRFTMKSGVIADSLIASNATIVEAIKRQDQLRKILGAATEFTKEGIRGAKKSESIFNSFFGKNSHDNFLLLMQSISPEAAEALRATVLASEVGSTTFKVAGEAREIVNFTKAKEVLKNNKTVQFLYAGEDLEKINRIVHTGERLGKPITVADKTAKGLTDVAKEAVADVLINDRVIKMLKSNAKGAAEAAEVAKLTPGMSVKEAKKILTKQRRTGNSLHNLLDNAAKREAKRAARKATIKQVLGEGKQVLGEGKAAGLEAFKAEKGRTARAIELETQGE